MNRGLCELRICDYCPLFKNICNGCINDRCLILQCFKGIRYVGITYPMDLCFFKNICPKYSKGLNIENLNLKIPRIIKQPPTQPYGLPRFIPVVSVLDKSSWIWRRLKVTHIVRLSELLQCREVLDSICREGIHNYLNFEPF